MVLHQIAQADTGDFSLRDIPTTSAKGTKFVAVFALDTGTQVLAARCRSPFFTKEYQAASGTLL